MHYVMAKGILSAGGNINLYRGCTHGCIYCDSRSRCYHIDHAFEDVEVKQNAVELLEDALQRRKGLRPGTLPFLKEIPIDARDAPNQRRGAGTGLRIRQTGEGRAGLGEDISIAGGIDNRLGKDCLTALLTLKYYTLYSVPIHNGTYASTVVQHPDRLPLLQQHLIQFNFQLVRFKIDRAYQPVRGILSTAPAVVDCLPAIAKKGIGAAHLGTLRAAHGTGDVLHALEPFLLQTLYKLFIVPGKIRNHNDISAGHIAAGIAIAIHQDDIPTAGPGRSNCRGMSGRAAADNE